MKKTGRGIGTLFCCSEKQKNSKITFTVTLSSKTVVIFLIFTNCKEFFLPGEKEEA